jgi:DNA mismatch repair protein MutS
VAEKLTPLMEQYNRIKKEYPDKILFLRMGDFYEMFGDDARKAAPILGIALTSRAHGKNGDIPLAGVPYHAAEKYLTKLVEAGEKVVICEQTEDPKLARGLVKREVVEIITPGTVALEGALDTHSNNYLAAVCMDKDGVGFSYVDLTTGEFLIDEPDLLNLADRLMNLQPAEILLPDDNEEFQISVNKLNLKASVTLVEGWKFDRQFSHERLCEQFGVVSLDGFGFDGVTSGISAAGAIIGYLHETKMGALKHISRISRTSDSRCMFLDNATLTNLEIVHASDGTNSLYNHLNLTRTAMGGRLFRKWIMSPLVDKAKIMSRQEAVSELHAKRAERKTIASVLDRISDLERIAGRLGSLRASPRDLVNLKNSLRASLELHAETTQLKSELLSVFDVQPKSLDGIAQLIYKAIVDSPPGVISDGGVIRPGYDEKLDQMKEDIRTSKEWIASLQARERERTGIPVLKVGYNKVFGYYIEITKPHLSKVPPDYIRKQTLVSAERFVTPDLKEKEELVLKAEEKINGLELDLFEKLREKLSDSTALIQSAALFVAVIDVATSLANVAEKNRYVPPEINDSSILKIECGRHPVLENLLPSGSFVPNDTEIDAGKSQIQIITGPNMAGKSTYLRQVGLIVLMAQVGSFVPADATSIGVVDRIFTRVGAADKLTLGQSTFLVEMNETANILNNATSKSLILLDEVGRGTSTYDGLSIAWSVAEFLHETPDRTARTLFATHYHELTDLAKRFKRVRNFQVAVREWQDQIIFIRKIVPGGCDDSYGIEVARLAGVPGEVTDRAKTVLGLIEEGKFFSSNSKGKSDKDDKGLFAFKYGNSNKIRNKMYDRVKDLQPERMTPLEALNLLAELKRLTDDDA